MSSGIWVFAEVKGTELLDTSLEAITEGRRLADQSREELTAVLLGDRLEGLPEIAVQYGSDRVFWGEDGRFVHYAPDAYTAVLAGLIREHDPSVFLLGATSLGSDLAARVAARVRTGLMSNCDRLQISDKGLLTGSKLRFGAKVHATIGCPARRPQMATIEPGVMKAKKALRSGTPAKPEMVCLRPADFYSPEDDRVKVVGFIKADPNTVDISDADIIVAGGKGVGDPKGFQCIRDLAELLKAAVAGSRVAVDNGCIGKERQIGQSGKTVSPELMISCGISGASAHTVGMRDSRTTIAINKDKSAPIMKMADLGVVGDVHEIVPVLVNRLREMTSGKK